MNRIIEIIDGLNAQNECWREEFEDKHLLFYCLSSEMYLNDTRRLIQQLMSEILNKQKALIDAHKEDEERNLWMEIGKKLDSEPVKNAIREWNEDIMEIYRNVRPLREAQENIIPIIMAAFEHLSVSYTPDFFQRGKEYGIEDTQAFVTVVLQLDRIVSVHVRRHFDKQTARREFTKATGLEDQYALVYAELYDRHLEKLQRNICIDKLEELTERVERLTQEVRELSGKTQN